MLPSDGGMHFYNRNGERIDLITWGILMEDMEYGRLARTTIVSAASPIVTFDVSTVWLGIDHSFGNGPLQIFETMVFGGDEVDGYRYSTEIAAFAGHAEMVTVVASTMDDPVIMDANEFERENQNDT